VWCGCRGRRGACFEEGGNEREGDGGGSASASSSADEVEEQQATGKQLLVEERDLDAEAAEEVG